MMSTSIPSGLAISSENLLSCTTCQDKAAGIFSVSIKRQSGLFTAFCHYTVYALVRPPEQTYSFLVIKPIVPCDSMIKPIVSSCRRRVLVYMRTMASQTNQDSFLVSESASLWELDRDNYDKYLRDNSEISGSEAYFRYYENRAAADIKAAADDTTTEDIKACDDTRLGLMLKKTWISPLLEPAVFEKVRNSFVRRAVTKHPDISRLAVIEEGIDRGFQKYVHFFLSGFCARDEPLHFSTD